MMGAMHRPKETFEFVQQHDPAQQEQRQQQRQQAKRMHQRFRDPFWRDTTPLRRGQPQAVPVPGGEGLPAPPEGDAPDAMTRHDAPASMPPPPSVPLHLSSVAPGHTAPAPVPAAPLPVAQGERDAHEHEHEHEHERPLPRLTFNKARPRGRGEDGSGEQ